MNVRIILKGGASSLDGELPVKDEEELIEFLKKREFFLLKRKLYPAVVAKLSIGYIERKQ